MEEPKLQFKSEGNRLAEFSLVLVCVGGCGQWRVGVGQSLFYLSPQLIG